MALQSKYQHYLGRPTADALAPGASLIYVPTSVTITEPAAIVKHHSVQEQQLKKKENFLNVVEGPSSICVEAETTIHFEEGGGTFLPGLDDNFLVDRTVSLPIIHIVSFDRSQRIQQIRLMWDQGSLLKSVEVVGNRGKNWPLRDGQDQLRVISSSVEASLSTSMSNASLAEEHRGRFDSKSGSTAAQSNGQTFTPRKFEREDSPSSSVGPRASAKPPQRDYHDLFAAGADFGHERSQSPSKPNPVKVGAGKNFHEVRLFNDESLNQPDQPGPERSRSPSKTNPTKAGARKNYHDVRLFSNEPLDPRDPMSPEKISIKTNPKKHQHFEFGEEPLNIQANNDKSSKHASQWDFSDFVTPEKSRSRRPGHTDRHFGWSDDEEEVKQPPIHRQQKPHPRKDAAAHFDFNDDATPKATAHERPRTRDANERMGLYQDHVNLGDPGKKAGGAVPAPAPAPAVATGEKMPLGNITNVNAQGHKKNFSSQFEMSDASPTTLKNENPARNLPETKKKATKTMEASWSMYDDSPPVDKHKGINIQGDGMGSRKGGEKPWWDYE